MKKFNINNYMYIQINQNGFEYLRNTVGDDYIKNCIDADHCKIIINGEVWYKLQCHQAFDLLPLQIGLNPLFSTNVMFDDAILIDLESN